MVNSIPAREIKRRGIGAVDERLEYGPVHVIRNDEPTYVVMTETQYAELLEDQRQAAVDRIRASLEDLEAGRVKRGTAQDLLDEIDAEP